MKYHHTIFAHLIISVNKQVSDYLLIVCFILTIAR